MPLLDPRANWVSAQTDNRYPKWECLEVKYNDPSEAQNDRNIYVTVLDADGTPSIGTKVWLDTGVPEDRSFQVTKANGACDFPQTEDSNFAPSRGERGPYSVYVDGLPSDAVTGMGLPLKQHVRYFLKFRRSDGSIAPPPSGKLTDVELARLCIDVGFGDNAALAVAVILAESGGDPNVVRVNHSPGKKWDGSRDRGLVQFNSYWFWDKQHRVSDWAAFNPIAAVEAFYWATSFGKSFSQWSTYRESEHLKYMSRATAAVRNVGRGT